MVINQGTLLEARNITKGFLGHISLDSVDLELKSGEIHILFGERGAGKSTLVKILSGVLPPDEGKIYVKGNHSELKDSRHACLLGISAVQQDFSLVPELSVLANLFLGQEIRHGYFLNKSKMFKEARSCLKRIRLANEVDLNKQVRHLTASQQQAVKITKSLIQDTSILIFDEPASGLIEEDRLAFYEIMNRLKDEGKGILYATDMVYEAERIADRVTILQGGQVVSCLTNRQEITPQNLLTGILGVVVKWKVTPGWPIEYASSNVESVFGYKPDDLTNNKMMYRSIIHPDDLKYIDEELKQFEKSGLDYFQLEYRILCRGGHYKWIHQSVVVIRDQNGVITHYRGDVLDITEAKQAQEALQQSQEKYKSLIRNIPDTIYSALPEANAPMVFISDRYREWTGFSPRDFYKDSSAWLKTIHPDDKYKAARKYIEVVNQKKEYVSEYRIVHKDTGRVQYVRDHSTPVVDNEGKVIRFDGVITNITRQKKVENELKESEEFLSNLLRNTPDPIIVINPDTSIKYINPALERLTGYSDSEVINHKAPYPWSEVGTVNMAHGGLRKQEIQGEKHREELFKKKDGEYFWVEISMTTVESNGKPKYYLESWNDVTTEKQLRENLQYYANAVTRVQENERKRISRELHDGTLQGMFSLCTDIEEMINKGECSTRRKTQRLGLEKMGAKISKMMDEVRQFCHELRPEVLDRFGLIPSLELLSKEMNTDSELKCDFRVAGQKQRLSQEIELVLFRVTQEVLHNVRKHSRATEVNLSLKFTEHTIQLEIIDNGKGFKVPSVLSNLARDGKFGLVGIRERVYLIGGEFSIKSEVNEGTTAIVEMQI